MWAEEGRQGPPGGVCLCRLSQNETLELWGHRPLCSDRKSGGCQDQEEAQGLAPYPQYHLLFRFVLFFSLKGKRRRRWRRGKKSLLGDWFGSVMPFPLQTRGQADDVRAPPSNGLPRAISFERLWTARGAPQHLPGNREPPQTAQQRPGDICCPTRPPGAKRGDPGRWPG